MTASDDDRHQQITLTNAALREWSAGLRVWSRAARGSAAECRRRSRLLRPAPPSPATDDGPGLPPLAPIAVGDLLELLVHDHGFPVAEAERSLETGLLVAGYPSGYGELAAADAFDLVEEILRARP